MIEYITRWAFIRYGRIGRITYAVAMHRKPVRNGVEVFRNDDDTRCHVVACVKWVVFTLQLGFIFQR